MMMRGARSQILIKGARAFSQSAPSSTGNALWNSGVITMSISGGLMAVSGAASMWTRDGEDELIAFAMMGQQQCLTVEPAERNASDTATPITLRWQVPELVAKHLEVAVLVGDSPDPLELARTGRLLATVPALDGTVAVPDPYETTRRAYFLMLPQMRTPVGSLVQRGKGVVTAERVLPLEGHYNMRDLGGMCGAGGRRIKWGQVYRHGGLDKLTAKDITYLESLGVKTNIDFRSAAEIDHAPQKLPLPASFARVPVPIDGTAGFFPKLAAAMKTGDLTTFIDDNFLQRTMANLAAEEDAAFAALLAAVADDTARPLSFQCTAGKDRTGWGAAVILAALGVSREDIVTDYLLTNELLVKHGEVEKVLPRLQGLAAKCGHPDIDMGPVIRILHVAPDCLQAAFTEVEQRHGGMLQYLENSLGMDSARCRSLQVSLLE